MPSGFFGGAGIGPQAIGRSGAPPDPVPVAGAELIVNGGFDTDTAWTKGTAWTIPGNGTAVHSPTAGGTIEQTVLAPGNWIVLQYTIVALAASSMRPYIGNGVAGLTRTAAGTYLDTGRVSTGTGRAGLIATDAALDASIDNVSYKNLTLASLLSARTYASADCDLSAAITRTAGTQAGLCARLDSASSPANFIIAYLDGAGNVKVDKCVGGTYTNVIAGAVTYGSTKRLRLVCSGTSVSAYYDGTQVGSTVTVSDAGIVSNTRHGKFSTYASNTFSGYVAA